MNITTFLVLFQTISLYFVSAKGVCMTTLVKIFIAVTDFIHYVNKFVCEHLLKGIHWAMKTIYPKYLQVTQTKHLIMATQGGQDVTPLVMLWYWSTNVYSCASLGTFMQRYGLSGPMDLIYAAGTNLFAARIDLAGEIELLSGKDIPFGSIEISDIEGKPIYF